MFISIIIPYHNRADLLSHTLKSIVIPSEITAELILVDNLSTDTAPLVAQAFAQAVNEKKTSFGVRLATCETPGASCARNEGLSLAKGEWTYFFDSDDEMTDDFFPDLIHHIKHHPEARLICLCTHFLSPQGKLTRRRVQYTASPVDQLLSGHLATLNMVFRTSVIRQMGGWNSTLRIWDDWELGLRALLTLSADTVSWMRPKAYHHIHIHSNSITGPDFSSAYPRLQFPLQAARVLISHKPSDKLFVALACREAILAGHLHREGSTDLAADMLRQAKRDAYPRHNPFLTPFCQLLIHLLKTYTAIGGRGAWAIARMLIPH